MGRELAKQIIFDCAMELEYGAEGLTLRCVAAKLLGALRALDELDSVSPSQPL